MAERIAEEKINEIRQSVDIVDVVGDHVSLTKQGRNYFGLCPFHGENTPSFSVSPDKQIYHCFGCHAGGDIFSFLMDLEGYSFQEAALKLAEKGNVKLDIDSALMNQSKTVSPDIQQMIEAHELLRKFYHHLLINTKDGQPALEYLLNRGFTMESIVKFQIGYSLNSWDFVSKFLLKRKYKPEIMERAGLIIKREKDDSHFDRFRHRIMFPIMNRKGNTIAFSGRSLGDDEPKYLNSPETVIFNKSKTLYNFQLARASIKKLQKAVLFEGFADVIASDRAGVENGVATMGTSLTEEHVSLLRKNAQSITICYDSDKAGIEAANRALEMLTDAGCQVRVALMPEGLDPDDYIRQFGEEKFRNEVIESSLTFMGFKLSYLRRGKRLNDEGDRLLYIEEVLKEISNLTKAVERDHYLRQLSAEFSLSLEALKEQQKQLYYAKKKQLPNQKRNVQQQHMMSLQRSSELKPAFHTAERRLLAHMITNGDIAFKVQELLQGSTFHIDEHQAIFTYLLGFYESGHTSDVSAFIHFINDDGLRRIVAEIEMMPVNNEISDKELSDYIKQVLNQPKMIMIKEKMLEEKEAERQKDYAKAALIAMEIIQLRKSL
ncbi:DNA primase [Cytobacillus purgationiresistens]|uniref:DNA primase n=1 Tax=Cytobacillus purgationiresistens TaxID=863449 RepID=A0ABU0AFC3_9BACI|nr:DNA primase [Cytobacillus purgationiresistens]MDQ0269482.1 DNA primase [Cytobacillus purgationiresistens]